MQTLEALSHISSNGSARIVDQDIDPAMSVGDGFYDTT